MTEELMDIIASNKALIYSIINKFNRYFDKEDLFQVGAVALIKAYKNYDKSLDTKFSSYAYFYIIGEVNNYVRESNVFKISKDTVELSKRINKVRDLLTQKLKQEPDDKTIANYLGISEDIIRDIRVKTSFATSLDEEDESLDSLYNYYGYEEKSYDPEIIDLKTEIAKLDPISKRIIRNRYILEHTQSETSKKMNMTQVMISRKEKEILSRLRTRLR